VIKIEFECLVPAVEIPNCRLVVSENVRVINRVRSSGVIFLPQALRAFRWAKPRAVPVRCVSSSQSINGKRTIRGRPLFSSDNTIIAVLVQVLVFSGSELLFPSFMNVQHSTVTGRPSHNEVTLHAKRLECCVVWYCTFI
jgi:hypothetical protein